MDSFSHFVINHVYISDHTVFVFDAEKRHIIIAVDVVIFTVPKNVRSAIG